MSGDQVTDTIDSGNNDPPLSAGPANSSIENNHILKNSEWLCGFRVDNIDRPQVLPRQVASYVEGATPFIEETNTVRTEVVTMYNKRESNYVHHGWSVGAIVTVSPWTSSRIHATNRHNIGGAWVTKRTLFTRLRLQVLLQDLAPIPEFMAAIKAGLRQPTRFERCQAVYMLSVAVSATEWRAIIIVTVAPIISLLTENLQAQLVQLYAERLSYIPPLAIEPVSWQREVYDDTNNASRTISRVGIRIGYYVDRLSVTYLNGETSSGGREGGAKHIFVLANGDYIIEMLTCTDNNNWLRGIQFITNTGRCSAIYGRWEDIPAIARSRGGILAGFWMRTKLDPNDNEAITGVWGIWLHDYISRVPKQNDVYSDYYGAKTQTGTCFNDRALVGNSSSMHTSSVGIGSGVDVDSIQNGERKTPRHGGPGDHPHQLELGDEEYIVSVSGRHNESFLTQLYFGTNLGRISNIYDNGAGKEFPA
ncbi:hypothetical protein B0J17DRAFT_721429 [Rhizoctonia solani]|nr:hypothetical protein B0J17DRAFT_721429 [Rhizoctonia solani]